MPYQSSDSPERLVPDNLSGSTLGRKLNHPVRTELPERCLHREGLLEPDNWGLETRKRWETAACCPFVTEEVTTTLLS